MQEIVEFSAVLTIISIPIQNAVGKFRTLCNYTKL